MTFLLSLLLACTDPPAALPPSALPDRKPPIGRMVRTGAVQGYLASPAALTEPLPGTLVLVDTLDEAGKAAARTRADAGTVVFVVLPTVDADAARAYLDGLPSTRGVTVACERAVCP